MSFARFLVLYVALMLGLAPLSPAYALAMPQQGDGYGAVHQGHDAGVHHHPAAGSDDRVATTTKDCNDHEDCGGICCASCAHCLSAVLIPASSSPATQNVCWAIPRFAHSLAIPDLPDRPPE